MQQETREVGPEKRHLTLLIIWGSFVFNIILFFLLANFVGAEQSRLAPNNVMTFALMAGGTFMVFASLAFKRKMLRLASERGRPQSVSSAYIVAFAMCEVAALCGLVLRLTTSERLYYLLFIIAIAGLVFNLPRRDDVLNASPVKRI
jgi:hypothetical protein